MSLQVSPAGVAPVLPPENASIRNSQPVAVKVAAPPPPPPPPPPQRDTVSLSTSIKSLQSQGDSPQQISLTLGVPLQTVSIDLGTSFIEATLAAAPEIPSVTSIAG